MQFLAVRSCSLTPNHRPDFSPGINTMEVCSMASGARLCGTAHYPSLYRVTTLQTSARWCHSADALILVLLDKEVMKYGKGKGIIINHRVRNVPAVGLALQQ